MGKLIDRLKGVTEFLNEALEATKEHSLIEAVARSTPWWAAGIAEGLAESLPVVNFLAKEASKYLADGPLEQGRTALTLAYVRSVEQGIAETLPVLGPGPRRRALSARAADVPLDGLKFDSTIFAHPFIETLEAAVHAFCESVGCDAPKANRVVRAIRGKFLSNLRLILTHPRTAERFAAFNDFLGTPGADTVEAQRTLAVHNQYTLWRYQRARVLGYEDFGLAHVYVELDCAELSWNQVTSGRLDAFSEAVGKRQPLTSTVLRLLGKKDFREPIVVQGIAGTGKSSFTLRLAAELMDHGFTPLRIELGDVDITKPVEESLPRALRYSQESFSLGGWDPLLTTIQFRELIDGQESIPFGEDGNRVSPYVLILDGWDEIVTGQTSGFRDDVEKLLSEVRATFFSSYRRAPQVHVVITGRPTVDVTRTKLMRDGTPLVTVRPYSPDQLAEAIDLYLAARRIRPLAPRDAAGRLEAEPSESSALWVPSALRDYRERFAQMLREHAQGRHDAELASSIAVLGLPLLSQLTLRLMAGLDSPAAIAEIVRSPCALYRALVDMTHAQGGKAAEPNTEPGGRALNWLAARGLRPLLWGAAQAISATGGEEISRAELKLRLQWDELDSTLDFDEELDEATKDNTLASLVIAFFFREGKHQGCRFLHKSFREYLFAESVVEMLKDFARQVKAAPEGLPERAVYWRDFDASDPRHALVRGLARVWATTWLTSETRDYLTELLTWEIARATTGARETEAMRSPTAPITRAQWEIVRDGLADAWDWWAEGVPLRCTPERNKQRGFWETTEPLVAELARLSSPQDLDAWKGQVPPDVVRTTTVDARLGDAFFLLTQAAHAALLQGSTAPIGSRVIARRRYQVAEVLDEGVRVRFHPSGEDPRYFFNFASRINSAGWRPLGPFPRSCNLAWVSLDDFDGTCVTWSGAELPHTILRRARLGSTDLGSVNLIGSDLSGASLSSASLGGANLRGASLESADLARANLTSANLRGANLRGANLRGANLTRANLWGADLRNAELNGARLKVAQLIDANLSRADLENADLSTAAVSGAKLLAAKLTGANLREADLRKADASYAVLRGANLNRASVVGANLSRASLSGANLRGADLSNADLSYADLSNADLNGATLKGAKLEGSIRSARLPDDEQGDGRPQP